MSKPQLTLSIGQHSSTGRKPVNQGFHGAFIPEQPLLNTKGIAVALADGISSSEVSHIAAETVVKSVMYDYYCTSDSWSVKTSVQCVLAATNSWLYAQTRHSPHRYNKDKGYICTFSGIIFKSNTAHIFHCGDSRIFRVSGKHLEQLTTDHRNVVSEEVSYLTRGIGINNSIDIDYHHLQTEPDDIFILMTDGVYDFVRDNTITDILYAHIHDLDLAAEQIIQQAYDAGSDDNLTVQIVKVVSLPNKNLNEVQQQIDLLPPPPTLQAQQAFDGYQILREISISNRSYIYLAQDMKTEQTVAIKTPSKAMKTNRRYLESFLREDWVAKRINNAHVLNTPTSTRSKQYLYTVTNYIEGKTLTQWMADNPAPDIDTVRDIIEQTTKGLQALHRQEMVHQDLRPNNIMIDKDGIVKIIGLGSAKIAGINDITTYNEGIAGTTQYTAPEYFLGELGTSRSDIFSLGVICYHMLSGKLPYGVSIAKTNSARDQQRLAYRSLTTNDNNIPGWIDYAIKKAVHIQPEKRYLEVSEFIHELKHPNPHYTNQTRPPLIERNPVLFWQCISFILLCVAIYQYAH